MAAGVAKKRLNKSVNSAVGKVNTGIVKLTEHQLKALNNFLCGKDSFVCLPTGHGKSLIYQLCPVVVKELSSSGLKNRFPRVSRIDGQSRKIRIFFILPKHSFG